MLRQWCWIYYNRMTMTMSWFYKILISYGCFLNTLNIFFITGAITGANRMVCDVFITIVLQCHGLVEWSSWFYERIHLYGRLLFLLLTLIFILLSMVMSFFSCESNSIWGLCLSLSLFLYPPPLSHSLPYSLTLLSLSLLPLLSLPLLSCFSLPPSLHLPSCSPHSPSCYVSLSFTQTHDACLRTRTRICTYCFLLLLAAFQFFYLSCFCSFF